MASRRNGGPLCRVRQEELPQAVRDQLAKSLVVSWGWRFLQPVEQALGQLGVPNVGLSPQRGVASPADRQDHQQGAGSGQHQRVRGQGH